MNDSPDSTRSKSHAFWKAHPFGLHYVTDGDLEPGTRPFYDHLRPWMSPFRFPGRLERIDRYARLLRDRHLLEIGCGLGFETIEYLKRGVRVTATDLTEPATHLARSHFELEGVKPEDIRVEDVLALSFPDGSFDAVSASGVVHYSGNTAQAIREIHRVLKPGGWAIIHGFYRRPSWMRILTRLARENIELPDEEAPCIDCLTEKQILAMFDGFTIGEVEREHFRAGPIGARRGRIKMLLYERGFVPVYNLLPRFIAERLACKLTVTASRREEALQQES